MKLVEATKIPLQLLKEVAYAKEDGNTLALLNKIERDLNSLMPEYQECTVQQAYDRIVPLSKEDAEIRKNFVAHSYERTGAIDVNKPPLPPTGEENNPPFVSKADVSVGESGALKSTPGKDGGVTSSTPEQTNGKKKPVA